VYVDLSFSIRGDMLPTDHHYLLYAALSHATQAFHASDNPVRFSPIGGPVASKGMIAVGTRARLRVRLLADRIGQVMPLAGRSLKVGEHSITLGLPTVIPLVAAPTLAARMVTFKHSTEPGPFLDKVREKLNDLGGRGQPGIPIFESGDRAGEPHRKVLRIHGRRIVGFELLVSGLTADESLTLQERGLGGRTRMGCGFFSPFRGRR
jgi:CRISPR-associated protein Cas6